MSLDKTMAQVVLEINQTASRFQSSIVIITDSKAIDAKSLLGLTYSVMSSKTFKLEIHGPDESQAKTAMSSVFWKHNLAAEVV